MSEEKKEASKGKKHPLADVEIVKVKHISSGKGGRSEIAVVYKMDGRKRSRTFHLGNGRDAFGRLWN